MGTRSKAAITTKAKTRKAAKDSKSPTMTSQQTKAQF
jgi:hypothetical protein